MNDLKEPKGYWVDLGKYRFDDVKKPTWIQAFPLGSYDHPVYGQIKIDPERVKRFAQNINSSIRDQQLDIDYDHKENGGKAAGWVLSADARNDGLWIQVDWTDAAYASIKNKEYKYFSPEFVDEWQHPKTQQTFQDVMFGGAITNRPFLKDILPINLSEVVKNNGGQMDEMTKALITALDLDPEKATPEDLIKAVQAIKVKPEVKPEIKPEVKPEGEVKPEPITVGAQLTEATVAKLLAEAVKPLVDKIAILETSNRLSETSFKISKLNEGKPNRLAPAVTEEAAKLIAGLPNEAGDKVLQLLSDTLKGGLIPMGEQGGLTLDLNGKTAGEVFVSEVDKIMKLNEKLSYADAVETVSREQPELFEQYRVEATSKK